MIGSGYISRDHKKYTRILRSLSEAQNHKCCYCGCTCEYPTYDWVVRFDPVNRKNRRVLNRVAKPNTATIEHIIPFVFHKDLYYFDFYNIAMACNRCNSNRSGIVDWDIAKLVYELFGRKYLGNFIYGFEYLRNRCCHIYKPYEGILLDGFI